MCLEQQGEIDASLHLEPRMGKRELLRAMAGHVLSAGELVGAYSR